MDKHKPFRETKLGNWLKTKAPKVLAAVGDVLPEKGLLGIVKNLVDQDPDVAPEDRLEFQKLLHEHELELIRMEHEDRASARAREIEVTKSLGHADYVMHFLVLVAVAIFSFIVWHLVRGQVPGENRELLTNVVGIVEGILMSIYTYYWGSSAGSRAKDMRGGK